MGNYSYNLTQPEDDGPEGNEGPERRGILVLMKKNLSMKIKSVTNLNYNTVMVKLEHPTTNITIFGVYGPSGGGKAAFFLKLRELTLQHADRNCLIIGDLNATLNENMDKKNYETDNHRRSRTVINNWINEGDFIDVFRAFYPDRHSYTYRV